MADKRGRRGAPESLDALGFELVSVTTGFLQAMIAGQGRRGAEFDGIHLWDGWNAVDDPGIPFRLAQLRVMPELLQWLMYAIVGRADRRMVGHVGFHGAPGLHSLSDAVSNGLEIGYTVFPPFRRRGYAVAAARALIQWAHREHDVGVFVASIGRENKASQQVAAKLGFKFSRDFDPLDPDREDIYLMHLRASDRN